MNRRTASAGRHAQRGQGLLLLMLVMLVAGASVLLDGIGSRASNRAGDDERTARVLAQAKEALIAYAVTDSNRPGELPCPDVNRDGVAAPPADYQGSNCKSYLGWLPWQTLDTEDVRDGSGARLWYAVSDAFHANGTVLINPDTAAGLTVDAAGATDIVAVILAPGEARGAQSRTADPPTGAPDANAHVAEYLEDGNAVANATAFVTSGGIDFNDRLVYITANELLRAVEQRVLGEVAVALRVYRQTNGAYPWLSPYTDPFAADPDAYDGVPGTRVGHIASIDASDSGTHTQDTGFTINWTAGDVSPTVVGAELQPLSPEALAPDPSVQLAIDSVLAVMGVNAEQDLVSGSETFPMPVAPTAGDPSSCTWQGDVGAADCQGTTTMQDAGYSIDILGLTSSSVQRQFSFDVAYSGAAATGALDGASVRNVSSSSPFQNIVAAVPSTVTVKHEAVLELLGAPFGRASVTRRLDITDGSTASVNTSGIYLDARSGGGLMPGELRLPAWFYTNQWDHFVLVKYASDVLPDPDVVFPVPPPDLPCPSSADCVNLEIVNEVGSDPRVDVYAVVIGAGREIEIPVEVGGVRQQRYIGGAQLRDYFEGPSHTDPSTGPTPAIAQRGILDPIFNDQVRVVEPLPMLPSPPAGPPPAQPN